MGKRISGMVFLVLLLAVPFMLVFSGGYAKLYQAASGRNGTLARMETAFSEEFPASEFLRRLQISLKYIGGNKEQNGVFISDQALMLDVQPKDQDTINDNTLSMIEFSGDSHRLRGAAKQSPLCLRRAAL